MHMTPPGHAAWRPPLSVARRTVRLVSCDYCGEDFDPIATRWLCPHCHMKANCCDGAPLAICGTTRVPDSSQ
jgi:hypothetical protein